jgi:hypothetical protein
MKEGFLRKTSEKESNRNSENKKFVKSNKKYSRKSYQQTRASRRQNFKA